MIYCIFCYTLMVFNVSACLHRLRVAACASAKACVCADRVSQ